MNNLIDKIFSRTNNLNYINLSIQNIRKETKINEIFNAIEIFSKSSEIRFVGGCIRKIINKEKVDDIDLAVNLNPDEVCELLKKKNIKFYKSGIEHGTITAIINDKKFEITSLRKDVDTDGRHAIVKFSDNWKEDASRRDFTINAIYADKKGNLFDPFDGKKDLENKKINFIGDPEKRIKEDYLRILRYIRFFLNYSKHPHDLKIIKIIKKNLEGIYKISSERLLDEFKKIIISKGFQKIYKDKKSSEIIQLIFPQFKNISLFNNLNEFAKKKINDVDFIFLLSLLIIDGTDNVDYFIYKYNIAKKDQKRLLFLNQFFSKKITIKTFSEKNLNKILYFNGSNALQDILYFRLFKLKKTNNELVKLVENFRNRDAPTMPIKAGTLIENYNIPEGKELGDKLKNIEEFWVNNNFKISEKELKRIIENN